jgi:HD superfamily phosphohydrolase
MVNGQLYWGSSNIANDDVLNHPIMQRLRWVKQLGQIDGVNSRAVHTRYDHSGYASHVAKHICEILLQKKRLPTSEIDIIQHTKLHDMGHPAFSHPVEYVLQEHSDMNHNKRALELMESGERDNKNRTLKDVLIESGADPENVRRLLTKENSASAICSNKIVGADKLAYSLMDAVVCGFNQQPPAWQALAPYLTFVDNKLGLDIGMQARQQDDPISIVCATQTFYFRMYTDVYLSPESLALERHIQKAVEYSIKAEILEPDNVWEMGDGALVHTIAINSSNNPLVKKAQQHLACYTHSGDMYHRAFAHKYERFLKHGPGDEAKVKIDPEYAKQFLKTFQRPSLLTELEDRMEQETGIPYICSVLPDPEKVRPANLPLFQGTRLVDSLQNYNPKHYEMLNECAEREFAIRLLVPKEHKEYLMRHQGPTCLAFQTISQDIIQRES